MGQIQVILAAHGEVSIKELCQVVMPESQAGICPGRAPANHRAADIVFCTREGFSSGKEQMQGCDRKMA